MSIHPFKSVLITGASSGIGRAVAHRLAADGVNLAITGRDQSRLKEVESELSDLGAAVTAQVIDVTDASSMSAFCTEIDTQEPLDLVIANAGVAAGTDTRGGKITREIFEVNVDGVVNTVLPVLDGMRSRNSGRIAIVSSIAGFRGMPTAPAYSASKVAVRAWGEAMRPGLTAEGIGLSLIFPGFVESRITDANDFPMPWMMPAEKAAHIIVNGLANGKPTIAFPWQMVALMRLITALPRPIFEALLSRAPKKT